MRYIEIDGKKHDVSRCYECPCYDGGDGGYGECCKHPDGDRECALDGGGWWKERDDEMYGPNCPLREKPELAEGGVIDLSKKGPVFLDPPDGEMDRELIVSESTLRSMAPDSGDDAEQSPCPIDVAAIQGSVGSVYGALVDLGTSIINAMAESLPALMVAVDDAMRDLERQGLVRRNGSRWERVGGIDEEAAEVDETDIGADGGSEAHDDGEEEVRRVVEVLFVGRMLSEPVSGKIREIGITDRVSKTEIIIEGEEVDSILRDVSGHPVEVRFMDEGKCRTIFMYEGAGDTHTLYEV